MVFLTQLLIASSVLLPTGSVYGFNVKILLGILVGLTWLLSIIKVHDEKKIKQFCMFISFILLLIFYFTLAQYRSIEISSSISHFTAIVSTFILFFFPWCLIDGGSVRADRLLHFLINVVFLHALIKCLIVFSVLVGIIDPLSLFDFIEKVFDYRPITIDTGVYLRLNVPSDYTLPVTLFFIINSKFFGLKFKKYKILLFSLTIVFAVIFSYSRYLWLYGFFALLISLTEVFTYFSVKAKTCFIFTILISILSSGIYYSDISDFISDRYFGENAGKSDSYRDDMGPALWDEISLHPTLGGGLGSHSKSLVRFVDTPWNYELQWLSFLMHFGFIGLSIVLIFLSYFFRFCLIIRHREILYLSMLYFLWLSVGFFNCFLLTSSAGVVFLLHFTAIWIFLTLKQ